MGKLIQVTDNLTLIDRMIVFAAETLGTAILLFLGCSGCVDGLYAGTIQPEQMSWAFGVAVLIAVQVFGHISGAHINPVVTIASATLGNISLMQVPVYFAGQFLGAFIGFGFVMVATPESAMRFSLTNNKTVGVCSPLLGPGITPIKGMIIEFLISLILTLVCCGVWDPRNADKRDSVPVKFGITIAGLSMSVGSHTGAHMNPARSLAPAALNGDWNYHWAYWVGSLPAGFLGALIYRVIFAKNPALKEENAE